LSVNWVAIYWPFSGHIFERRHIMAILIYNALQPVLWVEGVF
jgi:hypothetical protein